MVLFLMFLMRFVLA